MQLKPLLLPAAALLTVLFLILAGQFSGAATVTVLVLIYRKLTLILDAVEARSQRPFDR